MQCKASGLVRKVHKLFSFIDDPKEPTQTNISTASSAEIQDPDQYADTNCTSLHTVNNVKMELRRGFYFIVASKRVQYLGRNLIKY